jgi:hypothetical protein
MKKTLILTGLLASLSLLSSCHTWSYGNITEVAPNKYTVEMLRDNNYVILRSFSAFLAVCDATANGDLNCILGEDGDTYFKTSIHSSGFGPNKR